MALKSVKLKLAGWPPSTELGPEDLAIIEHDARAAARAAGPGHVITAPGLAGSVLDWQRWATDTIIGLVEGVNLLLDREGIDFDITKARDNQLESVIRTITEENIKKRSKELRDQRKKAVFVFEQFMAIFYPVIEGRRHSWGDMVKHHNIEDKFFKHLKFRPIDRAFGWSWADSWISWDEQKQRAHLLAKYELGRTFELKIHFNVNPHYNRGEGAWNPRFEVALREGVL